MSKTNSKAKVQDGNAIRRVFAQGLSHAKFAEIRDSQLVAGWIVLFLAAIAVLGVGCVDDTSTTQHFDDASLALCPHHIASQDAHYLKSAVDSEAVRPPFFATFGKSIFVSENGVSWKRRESAIGNFQGAAYGDNRIVALGGKQSGYAGVSKDGVLWEEHYDRALLGTSAVTYGAGKFVAVGEVFSSSGLVGIISTSPDGFNWTERAVGLLRGLHSVAYGGGKFVAVGSKLVILSSDGIDWMETSFGSTPEYVRQLYDVVHGKDTFVITGNRGSVFTSADGVVWEARQSGVSRLVFLRSVAYGNGLFVAVGDEYDSDQRISKSTVITSPNGIEWSAQYSGTCQSLHDVTFGDDKFVVVGQNETYHEYGLGNAVPFVLTSPNVTDWTMTEFGGVSWIGSVTFWPIPN